MNEIFEIFEQVMINLAGVSKQSGRQKRGQTPTTSPIESKSEEKPLKRTPEIVSDRVSKKKVP